MEVKFSPLTPAALTTVLPFLQARNDRFCDWTAGISCLWQEHYDYHYAVTDGCLIHRGTYDGDPYFSFPMAGKNGDVSAALTRLETYCRQVGQPLRFAPVTAEEAARLADRYPGAAVVCERDAWDYLYDFPDLAAFAGRHYSRQRNHIHQFEKACPDWQYRPIAPEDIPAVQAFLQEFTRRRAMEKGLSPAEQAEGRGIVRLLEQMPALNTLPGVCITGGMLVTGGTIAAVSIGERLGDTLYVHVEKGDARYPGIYPMMVREYAARNAADGLTAINREDDAGNPGLRQSKTAYRPRAMAEKYCVIV